MNIELLSVLRDWLFNKNPINGTYSEDILTMLYKCFYQTSIQVLMNKQPNNYTARLVTIHDEPIEGMTPIDILKVGMTNPAILDMAITDANKLDYNLRTEEMHPIGQWEVINSAATDIEILRAVVNVLTTVITSNQFLSVTRRYDPRVNNERTMQNRLAEDARIMKNKVNAIMEGIAENPNYDFLQGLIGGIHFDGMLDNTVDAENI
jgi:hypothetical protein